jgi:hypothetical protein
MKVTGVLLAASLIAAPAFAGEENSQRYEVQDFSAIEISGAYELEVDVGDDYSVVLTGSEEDLARTEVDVRHGALTLGSRKRAHRDKRHGDHDGVTARVTMPALDRLSVSGVVDADIRGVDAGVFKVNLSGVGEVTVAGRCRRLDARVSGVGELDARKLECADADVALSGMGEASVYARNSAKTEVSGMGEINVYGSPKTVNKRGGFFAEINVHE